jgi:hypothetical protein
MSRLSVKVFAWWREGTATYVLDGKYNTCKFIYYQDGSIVVNCQPDHEKQLKSAIIRRIKNYKY